MRIDRKQRLCDTDNSTRILSAMNFQRTRILCKDSGKKVPLLQNIHEKSAENLLLSVVVSFAISAFGCLHWKIAMAQTLFAITTSTNFREENIPNGVRLNKCVFSTSFICFSVLVFISRMHLWIEGKPTARIRRSTISLCTTEREAEREMCIRKFAYYSVIVYFCLETKSYAAGRFYVFRHISRIMCNNSGLRSTRNSHIIELCKSAGFSLLWRTATKTISWDMVLFAFWAKAQLFTEYVCRPYKTNQTNKGNNLTMNLQLCRNLMAVASNRLFMSEKLPTVWNMVQFNSLKWCNLPNFTYDLSAALVVQCKHQIILIVEFSYLP